MNYSDESVVLNECPPSLSARLEHLVGNSAHSDFTFIIEDDDNVEVPAHKLILSLASPVLDRIVYGSEAFSSTNINKVDGISKKSFMEILRYIYTDYIDIDEDNVFEVLHKANYFGLSVIETKCFAFLKENLNTSTVPWIFHHLFHTSPSHELFKKCIQFIRIEPMSFFAAEEFTSLSIDELKLILEMDAINCTEVNLFEALIKLAKDHCIAKGLTPTGPNLRRIVDGAENSLRLDSLTASEFDKCVAVQPDFFSLKEIEQNHERVDNTNPMLSEKRRKWYTYQNSVWIRVTDSTGLPASCFYSGSSNFIYRSQIHAGETAMLSNNFSQLFEEHSNNTGNAFTIEVLCGSGYEWRLCVNGEIPFGAVSLSQKNEKPVFVARGIAFRKTCVGPAYTNGKMYVFSDFNLAEEMSTSSSDSEREHLARQELSQFEILVANNVKNPYIGNGIPDDAIHIGSDQENRFTYLGRAWHNRDLLPAKVIFQMEGVIGAYVPYGTDEIQVDEFELVRMDVGTYKWEKGKNGKVPENAIHGGCTSRGETLYFGRVWHNGTYIPGKIHPSHKIFYAPHNGREINFATYEVLVNAKDNMC